MSITETVLFLLAHVHGAVLIWLCFERDRLVKKIQATAWHDGAIHKLVNEINTLQRESAWMLKKIKELESK